MIILLRINYLAQLAMVVNFITQNFAVGKHER